MKEKEKMEHSNNENKVKRIAKSIVAMANFGYYDGFRFYIYSSDTKERPHVHVRKDMREEKFWLSPNIEHFCPNGRTNKFSPKEIRNCEETIENHKEEFLQKFRMEVEKREREGKQNKSSQSTKKAYSISKITQQYLPIVESLIKRINHKWIKGIIPDDDEKGCLIVFNPFKNKIEPWLEICYFENQAKQHVHFEIIEYKGNKKFFEYESFVTSENQNAVIRNIVNYISKAYSGEFQE